MPLGVIYRVSFGFGVIFGEKLQKGKTRKIWAKRVPMLQRREPMPWRSPTPQRWVPSLRQGRGAKMAPLGYATTLFIESKFRIFVSKVSYSYIDSLRILIND